MPRPTAYDEAVQKCKNRDGASRARLQSDQGYEYSRYIIAWKLGTTMKAGDVTATLELALEATGCNRANVVHKPRLLSDNGSSYISGDLAEWLEDHGMKHVRGAP